MLSNVRKSRSLVDVSMCGRGVLSPLLFGVSGLRGTLTSITEASVAASDSCDAGLVHFGEELSARDLTVLTLLRGEAECAMLFLMVSVLAGTI